MTESERQSRSVTFARICEYLSMLIIVFVALVQACRCYSSIVWASIPVHFVYQRQMSEGQLITLICCTKHFTNHPHQETSILQDCSCLCQSSSPAAAAATKWHKFPRKSVLFFSTATNAALAASLPQFESNIISFSGKFPKVENGAEKKVSPSLMTQKVGLLGAWLIPDAENFRPWREIR